MECLKVVVEEFQSRTYCDNQTVAGIDMGIKYFMLTSEGIFAQYSIQSGKLSDEKGRNFSKQVTVLQ